MTFTRQEIEALLDAVSIEVARGGFASRDETGRKQKTALSAWEKLEKLSECTAKIQIEIGEESAA